LPLITSDMAPERLPPCVTRFGRAWPTWLVIIPENWYSDVGSCRADLDLGPKSTGLRAASDMLLGCALFTAWARECESVGDDGVLSTCFMEGGGLSMSSMLRIGCCGVLSTSSMLLTGAGREEAVLVLKLMGEFGDRRVGVGRSSPMSNMLRTGERGVVYGDWERPSSELGGLGRGFAVPSKRASTSFRSSSSIASIDIAWCRAMVGSVWRRRWLSEKGA
jgi:hypothetical protein